MRVGLEGIIVLVITNRLPPMKANVREAHVALFANNLVASIFWLLFFFIFFLFFKKIKNKNPPNHRK
jgi:hypothetical protein